MREFFSTEIAKLREMNFTDKRQYIWEYYKLHMLFIGIFVFLGGSLINIWFINPPMREYLYIAWQADHVPAVALEDFSENLNIIVENQGRYRASVRSYVMTDNPQFNQAIVTRFHALLSVGDVHAVIATSQGMQENADFGLIRHPEELLAVIRDTNQQLYAIVSERLLTITVEFEDDIPPVTDTMAIDISGAPLLVELDLSTDDLYLGFVSNSRQVDGVARALAVIFGL